MSLDGYTDLTGDGGVMKNVVDAAPDDAEVPVDGAKVTCHYDGKLWPSMKRFDSNDTGFDFDLGKGMVIKAWDLAVASMKKGERCEIVCKSQYGYGATGSPPAIPGDATLYFEITLVDWKPPQKKRSEMSVDELLEGSGGDKAEGVEHFKAGKYSLAKSKFQDALSWLVHVYGDDETVKRKDEAKLSLLLNRAAAELKLGEFRAAQGTCDDALGLDEKNVKALARRAEANRSLGDFAAAKSDLRRAVELEPASKKLRADYSKVVEMQKEATAKERAMCAQMFKGGLYGEDEQKTKMVEESDEGEKKAMDTDEVKEEAGEKMEEDEKKDQE